MSEAVFVILGGAGIVAVQLLVLGLLQATWERAAGVERRQLLAAWRQSTEEWHAFMREWRRSNEEWRRSNDESLVLSKDHSVALRAILERIDRDR